MIAGFLSQQKEVALIAMESASKRLCHEPQQTLYNVTQLDPQKSKECIYVDVSGNSYIASLLSTN